MAAIGAGLTQKSPTLFPLASASAMLFWVIEAICKSFQQAYCPWIRAIEAFMRWQKREEVYSPDITRSWSAAWRKTSCTRILWWGHVCLPDAAVVVAGILVWMWSLFYPLAKG